MRITQLTTDHLSILQPKSSRVSLTDPKPVATGAVDLVLVHLETDTGITGLGFATLAGPGAAVVKSLMDTELSPLVVGEDPRETDRLLAKVESRFRPVGFGGLVARAYSA